MRPAITELTHIPMPQHAGRQPRAQGALRLQVKRRAGRSVIGGLYQSGSLKCLFPRAAGAAMEAVMLNTAGGITGGDALRLSAEVGEGCALTLTTQACERAYKAQSGETGTLRSHLHVGAGARLNWLPQETLLYDGCALERSLRIDLAASASLLMVEPLVFGRTAMGERLSSAAFSDRIEIRRNNSPIYIDRCAMRGDLSGQLDRQWIANGAQAAASLVLVDAGAALKLDALRACLPPTAGASLLVEDVLVCRLLAADGFALRQSLLPALALLNQDPLPRCWTI